MQHIIVDGFSESSEWLRDADQIRHLLRELVITVEMRSVMEPIVHQFTPCEEFPGDGVTGLVIIEESHISIHTFPEDGRFHLDVFSCRGFDTSVLFDYLSTLGIQKMFAVEVPRLDGSLGRHSPAREDSITIHVKQFG